MIILTFFAYVIGYKAGLSWVNNSSEQLFYILLFIILFFIFFNRFFSYIYKVGMSDRGIHLFEKDIKWDNINGYYFGTHFFNNKNKCVISIGNIFNLPIYNIVLKNLNVKEKNKIKNILVKKTMANKTN